VTSSRVSKAFVVGKFKGTYAGTRQSRGEGETSVGGGRPMRKEAPFVMGEKRNKLRGKRQEEQGVECELKPFGDSM